MNPRIKFDKDILLQCMERDGFMTDVEGYDKLTKQTIIHYVCVCGNTNKKLMRSILRYGGYCKSCTKHNACVKTKQTFLKKYGVQHPMQCQEIIEKKKETCIKHYGVENPFQCDEVKEKIKQTYLHNHGVEHPMRCDAMKSKIKQTCLNKYGVENPSQCATVKEKMRQTCIEKYGVECSMQCDAVKEKAKQTCLQNHGVEHTFHREEVRKKSKQTLHKNYGVENPSQSKAIQDKKIQTSLSKYGVESPFQSETIKEKSKNTCIDKYGVEYPLQNPQIAENATKRAYKLKEYTFPDGRTCNVQGYEPFALDILVKNHDSYDIVTKRTEVPEVWYETQNKRHRYYPDIYIKSINKIIEVKSDWTYQLGRIDLPLKASSCRALGYEFEVWIFDSKRKLIVCDE